MASLNESIELSLALNLHDFEPAAGAHGAPALRYTYYYHATTVLEPSGGPSVGGTHVSVLGSGFDSFDGGAAASRCRFGTVEVEVAPGSLPRTLTLARTLVLTLAPCPHPNPNPYPNTNPDPNPSP